MARFSIIDPATFSGMQVIEVPDQEAMLASRMIEFTRLWMQYDPPMGAAYDVANLEFDPAKIIQELNALIEAQVRTRVNQAARAITLAFGSGTDLDGIASRYPGGVPRVSSEIYADDDPVQEKMIKDARYRERIWGSPNALSRAGTTEGYEYIAKTLMPDALDVASTVHRTPEQVTAIITVMMAGPNPIPTDAQILALHTALNDEEVRPLTDVVSVQAVAPIDIAYVIEFWLYPWAVMRKTTIKADIEKALTAKVATLRKMGVDHSAVDIGSVLNQHGVHSVKIGGMIGEAIRASPTQFINVVSIEAIYRGERE